MNRTTIRYQRGHCRLAAVSAVAVIALFGIGHTDIAAAEDESEDPLDEITVTSNRMGTSSIQDAALSITAVSGADMWDNDVRDIQTITHSVPNVESSFNAARQATTIRGVGTNFVFRGGDPSVTMQVNGVYIGRPSVQTLDFIDVERVEVLRGPQGTLYGRNAAAGTINVVTRDVPDEFGGTVRVMAGDYNLARAELMVGGPISDRLGFSIAAVSSQRDGYIENVFPGRNDFQNEDRIGFRAKLKYQATDRWLITLSGDYMDYSSDSGATTNSLTPTPFGEQQFNTLRTASSNELQALEIEDRGIALHNDFDITDTVTGSMITAYRDGDYRYNTDLDATETVFLYQSPALDRTYQFSHEMLLNGMQENFEWVTGTYYFKEWGPTASDVVIRPSGVISQRVSFLTTQSHSVFGQATWHLNERWSLTAGGRYTVDQKTFVNSTGGVLVLDPESTLPSQPSENPAIVPGNMSLQDKEWSAFTPKFALEFSPSDDTLLYASASNGFKVGGFNNNILAGSGETSPRPWDEETVWSYELGWKQTALDGRMKANLALFLMDYDDFQVFESPVIQGAQGFQGINSNASGAKSIGAELELSARPTESLDLQASFSYLDATYDGSFMTTDAPANTLIDGDGQRLSNAPEYTASLAATYYWETGIGTFGIAGDWSYRDDVFYSVANNEVEAQDAYDLWNARLFFESLDQKWSVNLRGKNLADEEYVIYAAWVSVNVVGSAGPPRTFTASVDYRF